MSIPRKTTGITAEERHIRSERLKSRLMGIVEGFDAGASIDAKEQENEISRLEAALKQIMALSTDWKYGNEGVHLLRINDIVRNSLKKG